MKTEQKNFITVLTAIAVFFIITFMPISGLEPIGRMYLGTTASMLILWFTSAVPTATTFFIQIGLTTLVMPMISETTTAAAFAENLSTLSSSSWSLLVSAFFLVSIVDKSGLARRLALIILKIVGPKPKRFLIGILFACGFLNLFLPAAMSVSALLTGIVGGIVLDYNLDKKSNLAKSIYLAVGVGTIAGNIFIQTAGAPAIAITNLIKTTYDYQITYFEYMKFGFPLALLMDVIAFFLITRLFPSEHKTMPGGSEYIDNKLKELGKWNAGEIKTGIVLLCTIALWMTDKIHGISASTTALLAVFVLICPMIGVYDFKTANSTVPWGTLLFCGSSLSLAAGIVKYGAAEWLVNALVTATNLINAPFIIILIGTMLIMAVCSCAFTVRASAISALIPCVIILAEMIALKTPGFKQMGFTMTMFYPLLFTVILPVHTPYTLIPQAAGGFESKDLVRVMIPYVLLVIVSCIALYFTYWKFIGLT